MNNAFVIEEPQEEKRDTSSEQGHLKKVIEAISSLAGRKEWAVFEEEYLNKELEKINRLIRSESLKDVVDLPKLYRLQGQREVAKRYTNIGLLVGNMRKQLENLTKYQNE